MVRCRHLPPVENCPVCRLVYGGSAITSIGKPRMTFDQLAEARRRCRQAKAAGLPCREFDGMRTIKWAYGVTTVPARRSDLLPRTLASLRMAGFDAPRLFIDGSDGHDFDWGQFGLPLTFRWPAVKAFANWHLTLAELLWRDPLCHRYAIFQDDLVCSANLRAYLDASPYPEKGYWNLITFRSSERIAPKGGRWFEAALVNSDDPRRLQVGRGAVALVFSREAALALLANPKFAHRAVETEDVRHKKIDGCVVNTMNDAGWREWVHSPSLVGHTGEVSTMGNNPHPYAGVSFRGEVFDLMTLVKR